MIFYVVIEQTLACPSPVCPKHLFVMRGILDSSYALKLQTDRPCWNFFSMRISSCERSRHSLDSNGNACLYSFCESLISALSVSFPTPLESSSRPLLCFALTLLVHASLCWLHALSRALTHWKAETSSFQSLPQTLSWRTLRMFMEEESWGRILSYPVRRAGQGRGVFSY